MQPTKKGIRGIQKPQHSGPFCVEGSSEGPGTAQPVLQHQVWYGCCGSASRETTCQKIQGISSGDQRYTDPKKIGIQTVGNENK